MILALATLGALLLLGAVQGATEFLPISSSGHLVLIGAWLGEAQDDNLTVEVALHLGTLVSVMVFCWPDLRSMLRQGSTGLWRLMLGSTVVTVAVALAGEGFIEQHLATGLTTGIGLMVTAGLLGVVAPAGDEGLIRRLDEGTWKDALILGAFQSLALMPGISRAGATIVAALVLGFSRSESIRIAFLMSVPIVAGAVCTKLLFDSNGSATFGDTHVLAGMVAATIVGLAALRFMSRHVQTRSLRLFAVYCATLGGVAILGNLTS